MSRTVMFVRRIGLAALGMMAALSGAACGDSSDPSINVADAATPESADKTDASSDTDPRADGGEGAERTDAGTDASTEGGTEPGPPAPAASVLATTAGGGSGTSTNFSLSLSIGGPQPNGTGASSNYTLTVGVPHAP